MSCQAEACIHKVGQQLYTILPACSRVLQSPIIFIERTLYSLLSARTRQILPAGIVTKLTILISPHFHQIRDKI